ncbi:hypothetical protein CNQ36_32985 (plasmid) [Streptomyces fungicidicus]|uniref:Uncharacterized protein n=1 Tax=Streptomyces fungicidicus TaxID=68203 RepID=A0A494V5I2_9ACTN|nr:hypothetical protein CNQ36_32985 [Streptomyces fungicidicus]
MNSARPGSRAEGRHRSPEGQADAPSPDSAYKMVEYGGRPVMKLSSARVPAPGRKQVFRRPGAACATGLAGERRVRGQARRRPGCEEHPGDPGLAALVRPAWCRPAARPGHGTAVSSGVHPAGRSPHGPVLAETRR